METVPESDYYAIDNRAVCHIPHCGRLRIERDWMHNDNTIHITGNANRACGQSLSMFSSQDFFLHTFAYKLRQKHIGLDSLAYGVCPEEGTYIYKVSRPLEEVLRRALKKSDNLCAEALFYHLSIGAGKKNVSAEDAQKAVERFMRYQIKKEPDNYNIVDGSGVSMYNYISPDLLVAYLKYAYAHKEPAHSGRGRNPPLPDAEERCVPERTCQDGDGKGSQFACGLCPFGKRRPACVRYHQPKRVERKKSASFSR